MKNIKKTLNSEEVDGDSLPEIELKPGNNSTENVINIEELQFKVKYLEDEIELFRKLTISIEN